MAQKRMIDKKISVSEQVANLPLEAQLIFTWAIPHSDDLGLLPRSPRTLKAMIIPMWDMKLEDFGNHLETIIKEKLLAVYTHTDGTEYLRVIKFFKHQTLKKDRKPQTLLNDIGSWAEAEALGFQSEDSGNPREGKGREAKGTREKDTLAEAQKNFDVFWTAYPNKVSKKKAQQVWDKLTPVGELFDTIMHGLEKAKKSAQWVKDAGAYIPHPTTWLNQERWNDEGAAPTARRVDKI